MFTLRRTMRPWDTLQKFCCIKDILNVIIWDNCWDSTSILHQQLLVCLLQGAKESRLITAQLMREGKLQITHDSFKKSSGSTRIVCMHIIVTGSGKTGFIHTSTEIQLLSISEGYTHALPRTPSTCQ